LSKEDMRVVMGLLTL